MRILIVDDHWIVRVGLRSLLEQNEDIEIVGEAGDAAGAVDLASKLAPELVILDLKLKGEASGIDACRDIKALSCPPRVLMHTAMNTAEDLAMATLAGADGYVHKGLEHVKLIEALRRVRSGEHLWMVDIGPQEVENKLERARNDAGLTPREQEVFVLLVRRYSNAEIAHRLRTSPNTTKNQVSSIFRKLGVNNRGDLFGFG